MFGECCPECGHLLSANRSKCPYCGWDETFDQLSYAFKLENIDNPDLRETVKELSQLDGAFIVLDDGVVPSACP